MHAQGLYTGILLAGGKSARMGTAKALLKINNRTLIEHILSILAQAVERTLLVVNDRALYAFLGVPMVSDIHPDSGPMGGIHAGLKNSAALINLVLACDLPLVELDPLRRLLSLAESDRYDMVLPQTSDGRAQPLCAVYKKTCLPVLERCLTARALKLEEVYRSPDLRVKTVTCAELPCSDAVFTNINTPAEYHRVKEVFRN
jgi:molybdopterin-guanine dinucleotide biosynthesis protein A